MPTTSSNTSSCPYDPMLLKGAPIGMFHCPECGEMILAGVPHINYDIDIAEDYEKYLAEQGFPQ